MKSKKGRIVWFLFGLGMSLQIVASLSFTEIFVYLGAIVLCASECRHMKRNGIMPTFWLSICVVINAIISCWWNDTAWPYAMRGLAVVSLIPCSIIVGHWMLRRDMCNFKWMLVGAALSEILCTFIFQKSVELTVSGGDISNSQAADAIMNGPLFWISRLGNVVNLYPNGWYLNCPTAFCVLAPLGFSLFAMLTSVSGRSTALGSIGAALFALWGGKRPSTIKRRVCKNFWLICLIGSFLVVGFKSAYQYSATNGWLGEEALRKYESQTKGGGSIAKLLMGGRMESFCGLLACLDRPFVGFGPWAVDRYGYIGEFLSKYASAEDYDAYVKQSVYMSSHGANRLIPGHSFITMFWLWFGVFGLVFWLYILYVLIRYLRQDCYAIPQWYMWLAAGLPTYVWNILFSPFGNRVISIIYIVAVLMVRAVRKGLQPLPEEMKSEIINLEKREWCR